MASLPVPSPKARFLSAPERKITEHKVLMLLSSGFEIPDIASKLSLSIPQVKRMALKVSDQLSRQQQRSLSALSRSEEEVLIRTRERLINTGVDAAATRLLDLLQKDDPKIVHSAATFILSNIAGFTPKTAELPYNISNPNESSERISVDTVERLANLVASLRTPLPPAPVPAYIEQPYLSADAEFTEIEESEEDT